MYANGIFMRECSANKFPLYINTNKWHTKLYNKNSITGCPLCDVTIPTNKIIFEIKRKLPVLINKLKQCYN